MGEERGGIVRVGIRAGGGGAKTSLVTLHAWAAREVMVFERRLGLGSYADLGLFGSLSPALTIRPQRNGPPPSSLSLQGVSRTSPARVKFCLMEEELVVSGGGYGA